MSSLDRPIHHLNGAALMLPAMPMRVDDAACRGGASSANRAAPLPETISS
jgi:hypothetical protein